MIDAARNHDQVRQARNSYIRGEPLEIPVRDEVMSAWRRCNAAEIPPTLATTNRISGRKLDELLAANAKLISIAEPLLQQLYHFLEGNGFVVSLSDTAGCMIYVIGDSDVIASANDNLLVGANWGEIHVGNNAVGTSLRTDAPCQFWGFEHYARLAQRWAGSGCPIHDSEGKLIGSVAISGPVERSHLHTLGMVVMTAHAVEMQIKLNEVLDYVSKVNEHQTAIINSISEGLIIVDAGREISLVNDFVVKYLQASHSALLGMKIEHLITDENLLSAIRSGGNVTDYITELVFGGKHFGCTVTCRKITQKKDAPESLILISEIMRAKNLVQRIGTGNALLTFNDIVGEDLQFRSTINFAKAAAETSANVLILGESGTGKEVFAQAIHSASLRKDAPFIAVNCGAIPKELIASTLFGYEEGAFTGAKKGGNPGKFELADRGTLFLDEIGELSLDVQSVLLRVLDQKAFSRVGGKKNISVDVRIIAATNRDLLQESRTMHFRQDLYYRLNVFSIHLPPLRARKGDINPLSEHFLQQMCRRYQRNATRFSNEAKELLLSYHWPGNIRELQNVVERAVVLSTGEVIDRQSIPPLLMEAEEPLSQPRANRSLPPQKANANEREQLVHLLEEYRWNISKAAVHLGVARSTLYRKLHFYNLK